MGEIIYVPPSKRQRDWVDWSKLQPADARRALTILAEEGQDATKASARCSQENISIAAKDLIRLRDKDYPDLWVQVTEEHQQELEKVAKHKALQNAIKASNVASRAVDRIADKIDDANIVEASKALDSLSKAQTTNTDVLLKHEGRPVQGGQQGTVADVMRWFQEKGLVVDGSAVEEPSGVEGCDGDSK